MSEGFRPLNGLEPGEVETENCIPKLTRKKVKKLARNIKAALKRKDAEAAAAVRADSDAGLIEAIIRDHPGLTPEEVRRQIGTL